VRITFASEGIIDRAVIERLILAFGCEPGPAHGGRGKGLLDSRIDGYNAAALHEPWVVFRDLDEDAPCAPELRRRILPDPSQMMCFRVVVREIESWLLGDIEGIREQFKIRNKVALGEVDQIANPKRTLLDQFSTSRDADIRRAMVLVSRDGAVAEGPLYNANISEFVHRRWNIARACNRSESLRRAYERIKELSTSITRRR